MNGKSVHLLVCLVSIVVVANCVPGSYWNYDSYNNKNLSHNLVVGARQPGDRLVFKENVIKESSWFRIVTHQRTFNISKYERITQVRAMDQKGDGHGATASLMNGGPGYNSATLRFKSQRNHGIHFVVELYARH